MTDLPKPPVGQPCNGCGLCCRAQVCAAGSFGLRLVNEYGRRAPGPCPALIERGDKLSCGVIERPLDWLRGNRRGPSALRQAMSILVGAGLGCDEAGPTPTEADLSALDEVRVRFLRRFKASEIEAAVRALHDRD